MKRSEKANLAHKILNRIYKKVPIPLTHTNKFELVVAVLLSAQCTDERVNRVSPLLFKKANTAQKMIKIPRNTIYKIIRPCGLAPQKSKAIYELSRILVKKFKGKVPNVTRNVGSRNFTRRAIWVPEMEQSASHHFESPFQYEHLSHKQLLMQISISNVNLYKKSLTMYSER